MQANEARAGSPRNSLEDQTYAAIDLGSNSFHLIVARLEHGSLDVIDRIKDMVRLAEGVDAKGRLDPAVAQRALDCLARFGERLAGIPPACIAAVGTNALRRLRDGWQFLDRMEAALGHRIEVISGEEEARLIYLGVAHGVSEQGKQRLVIDIGGGSTELAIGRESRALQVESLFFGCVAVAQRFFDTGKLSVRPAVLRLTALLRLAALFCRSRIAADAAWIGLTANDATLTLALPSGWSDQHPLTAEDLRQERAHLKKLGVRLKLTDGRR